jgi:hypothetical protein
MSIDLRAWLRRAPRPSKLRYKNADDETNNLELGSGRTRFINAEKALKVAGAVTVEALTKDGSLIRAVELNGDDDDDGEDDTSPAKAVSKERRELAGILAAQGRAIADAYKEGANAASASSEQLTTLVDTLTQHLALAITNINNLSVNLANAIRAGAMPEGEPASNGNGEKLFAMLAPLLMGAGIQPPAASPPKPAPNGKK